MDNTIIKQEDSSTESSEESIIPVELIKEEIYTTENPDNQENQENLENIENIECMEIDEMSPKNEESENNISDPILDLQNMKICEECGIHTDCITQIKENGEVSYFCTDKCMSLNYYNKMNGNTRPSMKINDAASLYVRVCSTCSAIIHVNFYSNISWQARDFCNEKCLTKHQIRFNSFCMECKCSIIDLNNFGKFSMKFGNNIRTFCSKTCLDKYKITLNMCQFCNNDIPTDAQHKYLAPVTENSSTFKQFCSIDCVKNYCRYKLKLPYQNEAENYANCMVCNSMKYVDVKYQNKDCTFKFCSEGCFIKFQCFNETDAVQCFICKILYDKVLFQLYSLYDNGAKNFCSQNCQNTYYIIARYIVECNNCQVKKYNFDMIQKTFPNNQTIYACSFHCLKNSYRKMSRPVVSSCSQHELKRLYLNLKNMMTLSIARNGALSYKENASTLCYPIKTNASTLTDCTTEQKYTQTNNSYILIPTPVPIYVPSPVPVAHIPVPVGIPIPIPIPVPIFIPTCCKTPGEIPKKMNQIFKELPQDPLQADLIMLAKNLGPSNIKTIKKKPKIHRKRPIKQENNGCNIFKHWIIRSNKQIENSSLNRRLEAKNNLYKTNILYMTRDELHTCLIDFFKYIKESYSSDGLSIIFLDLQKYLLDNNKQEYIFLDPCFKQFIECFNEITSRSIYKITLKLTERFLWETNQLGVHTPYTLINSLIYYNYKLFGLKTVQEHMKLYSNQITFSKKPILTDTSKYVYRLKYFNVDNKKAEVDKQFYNQKRCAPNLYEFYVKKCPTYSQSANNKRSFYLKPETACEPDSPIWFSNQMLDEWTIQMMLNRIKMVKEINEVHSCFDL